MQGCTLHLVQQIPSLDRIEDLDPIGIRILQKGQLLHRQMERHEDTIYSQSAASCRSDANEDWTDSQVLLLKLPIRILKYAKKDHAEKYAARSTEV